jgi:transglutaminase-like putative cysteine protease
VALVAFERGRRYERRQFEIEREFATIQRYRHEWAENLLERTKSMLGQDRWEWQPVEATPAMPAMKKGARVTP